MAPPVPRRLSDNSTEKKKEECRRIETLFPQDLLAPKSVHGDNFYLPAQIIYEARDGCADKRVRGWSKNN